MDTGEFSLRSRGGGHACAQVSSDSAVRYFIPEENFVRRVQTLFSAAAAKRSASSPVGHCSPWILSNFRERPANRGGSVGASAHSRAIAAGDRAFIANKIMPFRVIESTDPPTPERGTAPSAPRSRDEDRAEHQLHDEIMRQTDPALRPLGVGSPNNSAEP